MPGLVAREYTHDGRTMTLKGWAEHTGVKVQTLQTRLTTLKWTFAEAIAGRRDPRKHLKRVLAMKARFKGKTRTLAEWAEEYGVHPNTIRGRMSHGWTAREAITGRKKDKGARANKPMRRLTFKGKTRTLAEWAEEYGVSSTRINNRLRLGWTDAEAITGQKKDKWAMPKRPELQLTFRGVTKGVSEWAKQYGRTTSQIRGRLRLGWTDAEAITGQKTDQGKARRHGVQSG